MTQQFELFCAGTLPGELAGLDQGRVLAAGSMHSSVLVQRLAVRSLLPCVWLNDEVLNFAMWELQQRDGGVSCHFFPISFMTQFRAHLSYAAVKRHTTPAALARAGVPHAADGVLSCSLVVAPVNVGGIHWTLVVADLDRQRILYIDPKGVSLGGSLRAHRMIWLIRYFTPTRLFLPPPPPPPTPHAP